MHAVARLPREAPRSSGAVRPFSSLKDRVKERIKASLTSSTSGRSVVQKLDAALVEGPGRARAKGRALCEKVDNIIPDKRYTKLMSRA